MAMEWNPPVAPDRQEYNSPYQDELKGILDDLKNMGQYDSEYKSLIDQTLSNILNRPKFEYDADSDLAYQSFLQRANRMGEQAFQDNMGAFASMTGGRLNSWAGTIATQAKNEFLTQASEAVTMFEDRAYSRYRDEGDDLYRLLGSLQSLDADAYSRWRDTINDKQQMFNMVMQLDDREFRNFEFMVNDSWKRYEAEYKSYLDALTEKDREINRAWERTRVNGYVSNEDSIVLGVAAGTPSFEVQQREAEMKMWLEQQKVLLDNDFKKMDQQNRYDKELIKIKHENDKAMLAQQRKYSGGSVANVPSNLSQKEIETINTQVWRYKEYLSSGDFDNMAINYKRQHINNTVNNINQQIARGYWGANSQIIGQSILMGFGDLPQVRELIN